MATTTISIKLTPDEYELVKAAVAVYAVWLKDQYGTAPAGERQEYRERHAALAKIKL